MRRCGHTLDPETWEREHNEECQIYPEDDADILQEVDGRTIWRCPHEAVGEHLGEEKCVFHLPEGERPDGIDPVEEFVAIVEGEREAVDGEETRPSEFIDTTFDDLDLDRERIGAGERIDLRHARIGQMVWTVGAVDASLNASGAVIEGECRGEGVSFGGEVRFRGATFETRADFSGATFETRADFSGATFEVWAYFSETTFEDSAYFSGADFSGADFSEATFEAWAYFLGATFEVWAYFSETTFEWRAYFSETTFEDSAYFWGATFEARTDFTNAVFEAISFNRTVFDEDATFRTDLSEKWFPISMFQGPADFTDLTARNGIDFRVTGSECSVSDRIRLFAAETDFTDASLSDSNFAGTRIGDGTDLSDATLEGSTLRDADFSGTNLENAELEGADLRNVDLFGANLENAILTRTQLYGTDFTDARLHGTLFGDARISDATTFIERGVMWSPLRRAIPYLDRLPGVDISEAHTVIYDSRTDPVYEPEDDGDEESKGDDEADEDEDISNHTRAAMVYRTLESLARDNAASTLASTCFAWRKDMERKRFYSDEGEGNSRRIVPWGFSWLSNLVTRYGESPYRVLATAAVVILSCGGLYYWFGLIRPDLNLPPGEPLPPVSLFNALYFSTMTFTTLGYGDFRPANQYGQLLAVSETSAGVILLALLVFVFGRRATR